MEVLIRYLGCLVGIDLPYEVMLPPLLLSIKRKLVYWDSQQLSLAGRVVIANSVLLASMWFIAFAWLFSRSAIMKVQSLIHNFLWGRKNGSRAVVKVAWDVLIRPKMLRYKLNIGRVGWRSRGPSAEEAEYRVGRDRSVRPSTKYRVGWDRSDMSVLHREPNDAKEDIPLRNIFWV